MRRLFVCLLTISASLIAETATAQVIVKNKAADFPPGEFTDGGRYQMSDFAGKALALYFFESS